MTAQGEQMRRYFVMATTLGLLAFSGTAAAASIDGRLGFFGKAGGLIPLKDDFISSTSDSKAGFAAGAGLIYGICRGFAVDLDVTHVPELNVDIGGAKAYEASFTDAALGAQYRFDNGGRLAPYLGLGADFIKGDLTHVSGAKYDMDWTFGGHVEAGLDYFLTRGIALFADFRGVYAADGDLKSGDTKVGTYRPLFFVGTLGLRLFLPERAFRDESL